MVIVTCPVEVSIAKLKYRSHTLAMNVDKLSVIEAS